MKINDNNLNPQAVFILALIVVPLTVTTMFLTFWSVYLVEEEVRGRTLSVSNESWQPSTNHTS